jgi:hypothetical protein
MLLLHQVGSLKIGEVVRYTVTYTPAHDRILPSPPYLFLRIKNTSLIALRAAFVHGPYTLYAAAYPAEFDPNKKFENPARYGVPEFEPQLKAGGAWEARLDVPEVVRETAGQADRWGRSPDAEGNIRSVSWIIEVASQVIFSNSAAVHYEILLGRDEKSLGMGFASSLVGGGGGVDGKPGPGQVGDHQQSARSEVGDPKHGHKAQPKGVFSKAIRVMVDDTASLWNTPRLPEWDWDEVARVKSKESNADAPVESVKGGTGAKEGGHRTKRQKKVHLVVLTHGLHSNLGADMLFLKESIDATAKQAKIDSRARRHKARQEEKEKATQAGRSHEEEDYDEDEDEEEVIVRGFSGNAVRTERGIKYLGKRLARYVLAMTYPDQPFKPVTKKSATEALSHALRPEPANHVLVHEDGPPAHKDSTILKEPYHNKKPAYKITSISFIAHSLGGLIQTYAIAYIQKHSPEFFDRIKPINFIALASPFLGLSNENPLYVKFALDFGLVGRTGQDLGLTWRAPTIARSGWGAIVGGIGESAHKKIEGETPPESKPLLRILPTGPAYTVLKKFRNRTVYSNVVNDGIVPLRTSCLLFLDWQGLGRVEKARRENGLVGTMAGWGWAELTGANSSSPSRRNFSDSALSSDPEETPGDNTPTRQGHGEDVPQPSPDAIAEDDARSLKGASMGSGISSPGDPAMHAPPSEATNSSGPLANILKFFQPAQQSQKSQKSYSHNPKHSKIYKRSQTLRVGSDGSTPSITKQPAPPSNAHGKATTGDHEHEDPERLSAPPRTTFFESAGDVLKPPLPSVDFLIDPSLRPRTIFHDRVYHPEDIPPPPLKKRPTSSLLRRRSSVASSSIPSLNHPDSTLSTKDYDDTQHTNPDKDPREVIDGSAMKVEEKIARAYHRDLSWRKVLVRLEPDAHNNMIVRRMFANAYGWPVIKHLCDTHFSDSAAANTPDDEESGAERAKGENDAPNPDGGETNYDENPIGDQDPKMLSKTDRTDSERREAQDSVPALKSPPQPGSLGKALAGDGLSIPRPGYERADSDAAWSDRDWADSEQDTEDEEQVTRKSSEKKPAPGAWNWMEVVAGKRATSPKGTRRESIDKFLGKASPGEGPTSPGSEVGIQLKSDAAAVRVLSGEAAGMGIGLGQLGPEEHLDRDAENRTGN